MENLPSEIWLKICSYLHIWEKNELGLACKRMHYVVLESWQDFAVMLGWNKDSSSSWLACCKKYMLDRRKWFTGRLSEHKIYFKDTLNALTRCGDTVALSTENSVYCYAVCRDNDNDERLNVISTFINHMDVAEETLFLSDTIVGTVDALTSELVYFDLKNFQQSRIQLKFNVNYDFCHCTDAHIILFTDCGKIFFNTIGTDKVVLVHEDKDEIAHSYIHNNSILFVSYWSGLFVAFQLNKPEKPVFSMVLELVFYSIKASQKYIYFGSAEGDIGRIPQHSPDANSIDIFSKKHCDSVYCISLNRTILVSGGADSQVIFWSLRGEMLYCDSASHVGIVRHIYLNEWLMVTAGDAHMIIIWDPILRQLKHILHHNPLKIKYMLVDGKSMVYGTPNSNYVIMLSLK